MHRDITPNDGAGRYDNALYDPLRSDLRFQALLDRLGLPDL